MNNIGTDMAICSNARNVEDLKNGIVFVLHLTLDVLDHHIRGKLHDDGQSLLGAVLLYVGHVFFQIAWKGPSAICINSNKEVFIILNCFIA